ncbi:MAG: hypothetical protein DRI70_01650 [Bacteroidetes bacterium]|nr:MAG: hypothetical protein DRI70_01650 [Bacteroidota bacterium]
MNITDENHVIFYQKMGELFYAIAASDKVVRKTEYDALRKLVRSEWSSLNHYEDEFGVDAAYQMEITFDWFDYKGMDANDCFNNFKYYIKEKPQLFTTKMKQLIWKTSNAIARAFAGKNKSELIMLAKLKMLLEV